MDIDGDGHISKDEFIAAEKKVKGAIKLGDKWDDIMKNCDLDGDGKIDFQEYKDFINKLNDGDDGPSEEQLKQIFDDLDTN